MFELVLLDLKKSNKFNKIFDSEYLKNKFKNKCKYSKRIKIIADFKI